MSGSSPPKSGGWPKPPAVATARARGAVRLHDHHHLARAAGRHGDHARSSTARSGDHRPQPHCRTPDVHVGDTSDREAQADEPLDQLRSPRRRWLGCGELVQALLHGCAPGCRADRCPAVREKLPASSLACPISATSASACSWQVVSCYIRCCCHAVERRLLRGQICGPTRTRDPPRFQTLPPARP
jgi:hypothetical protein